MSSFRILAVLCSLSLAACLGDGSVGDSSGGGSGGGGGGGAPDGGAGMPSACAVEAAYPYLGAVTDGSAVVRPQDEMTPAGPQFITLAVSLGGGELIDAFFLQLWDGYGVFTNGVVPGTYTIAGAEADLNLCGACVWLAGDIDMTANSVGQELMALGGTLTITAVDPTPNTGRITGSLTDVIVREVTYDPTTGAQTDVPGGCESSVAALSFDVPVVPPN